ncbi:MAG: arginine--tRNA ligase, partial [Candidatus Levyibacteriota bacterium]
LTSNLSSILEQKEKFGQSEVLKNKKVMVEFTDPNPLKEFHIGHLYSNAVGEALSRLFESQGAEVWRVCYQGDVGLHVAKALWGINSKLKSQNAKLEEIEKKPLPVRAKFLGEAYALGAAAYTDEKTKEEIIELNKKVYEKDPEIFPLYEKAKQWSLDYFETIYKTLGTKFVKYYFESEAGPLGKQIVEEHMGDIFRKENGAVIFPKEKSGLHTRVFINSLGLPTYEAKELGLAPKKYADFPYDTSIIVTGNEINEYFKVLLKALSLIKPDLAQKTKHVSHGMVKLPGGKMSSRTGDVITGDRLISETKSKIKETYEGTSESLLSEIAVGAIKYTLLKSHIGADIVFDLNESINLHGNSGPYLQYAYARTQSILGKAQGINREPSTVNRELAIEELDLLRTLVQFPEVVQRAQLEFAPSYICTYLFDLTQKFSLFYEKHRVINAENEEIRDFRLILVAGVGQVLKNGLTLLGIKSPEKI